MRVFLLTFLLLLLSTPGRAQADLIYPKKGRPTKGKVWEEGDQGVTYNRYRTGIRKVTHGTVTLPAKKVKKVVADPHPHRSFWRKAEELKDGTADQWVALGLVATKRKLKRLARLAFTEALVRDRESKGARKGLGSARVKQILSGDPRLNAALKEKLTGYLALADAAQRKGTRKELAALGCGLDDHYLERAWRSGQQRKGRTNDRVLTLRSKEHKGKFTLFVPSSYDPFSPTPLVIGLHGGGVGGKDRKAVVGSGASAMNFYERGAEALGWLVACPTAVAAPWNSSPNHGFVLAVLDEMRMLFNVDENRIYLTGHSMGGFGTWSFGPRYAHLWAAISPMAGGARGPNLQRLQKTMTGVYLYHGANDNVVSVGSDRAIGARMLKDDMDFVYAEIPDSGHGFPPEVAREMWDFFKVRRLAVTPQRNEKGKFKISQDSHSSFDARASKEEVKYFGPIGGKGAASANQGGALKNLIKDLKVGGGLAEKAAPKLGAIKTRAAVSAVGKVLGNTRYTADTRRWAATALGEIGRPEALKYLKKAVIQEEISVVVAVYEALGRIPQKGNAAAYSKGVKYVTKAFDKKKTGSRMSYSDFEPYLAAAGRMVTAMAAAGDKGVTPTINGVAENFLLVSLDVPKSARAGHYPSRVRRRLAATIVDAYERLADPACKESLESIASRSDFGVEDRARELLLRLQ